MKGDLRDVMIAFVAAPIGLHLGSGWGVLALAILVSLPILAVFAVVNSMVARAAKADAPRDADLVASYWQRGRRLWDAGTDPHGPRCACLACAGLREKRRLNRPPLRFGGHVIETLPRITAEVRHASTEEVRP